MLNVLLFFYNSNIIRDFKQNKLNILYVIEHLKVSRKRKKLKKSAKESRLTLDGFGNYLTKYSFRSYNSLSVSAHIHPSLLNSRY